MMAFPYTAWVGTREGHYNGSTTVGPFRLRAHWTEVDGMRVSTRIGAAGTGSPQVLTTLDGDHLEMWGDVDGEYMPIYSGPFPITKAALIDAFAKLIEDSLKEDT